MKQEPWEYELIGEWTFRVCPTDRPNTKHAWMSEAKRGPFRARTLVEECFLDDCYFEYGATKNEALIKLKAEVLALWPPSY